MAFPYQGVVFSESGASMPTSYTGAGLGSKFQYGAAARARYVAKIHKDASSSMTAFTVKLQGYDPDDNGPCDFVSVRDDNGTSELEHAFTVSAGDNYFSFYADPRGFKDIRVCGKATGTSHANDTVSITCMAF